MSDPKKITVLFNDLILLRQKTGIAQYAAQLLERLPEVASDIEVVRLSETPAGRPIGRLMRGYGGASSRWSGDQRSALAALRSIAKRAAHATIERYFSSISPALRFSLLHEPDAIPFAFRGRTITTVHDLSVLLFPHWHPAHRVKKYERRLKRALTRTTHFIAVSDHTKREMIEHLRIEASRISVIAEAPRAIFRPQAAPTVAERLSAWALHSPYFLHIGTLEPRKNIEGLLQAYARLAPARRRDFPLVLAGGWGWNAEGIRALLDRSPWREEVRCLGFVSDEDLVTLTNGARAVVYPSFYEGFGLPPLEAMACGTPVIASHAGGLKEAVADAAHIVDPANIDSIAEALTKLAEDASWAEELRARGTKQIGNFSWDRTAEQTANLYREVAGRR